MDALQLLNELQRPRIMNPADGKLPPITDTLKPAPYLDVNGDGYLAPSDVLQVINRLQRDSMSGEGESARRSPTQTELTDAFWSEYGR